MGVLAKYCHMQVKPEGDDRARRVSVLFDSAARSNQVRLTENPPEGSITFTPRASERAGGYYFDFTFKREPFVIDSILTGRIYNPSEEIKNAFRRESLLQIAESQNTSDGILRAKERLPSVVIELVLERREGDAAKVSVANGTVFHYLVQKTINEEILHFSINLFSAFFKGGIMPSHIPPVTNSEGVTYNDVFSELKRWFRAFEDVGVNTDDVPPALLARRAVGLGNSFKIAGKSLFDLLEIINAPLAREDRFYFIPSHNYVRVVVPSAFQTTRAGSLEFLPTGNVRVRTFGTGLLTYPVQTSWRSYTATLQFDPIIEAGQWLAVSGSLSHSELFSALRGIDQRATAEKTLRQIREDFEHTRVGVVTKVSHTWNYNPTTTVVINERGFFADLDQSILHF